MRSGAHEAVDARIRAAFLRLGPVRKWLEGGCWSAAEGILEWYGSGTLAVIRADRGFEEDVVDHVIARLGKDIFADARGVFTAKELISRWEHDEGIGAYLAEDASREEISRAGVQLKQSDKARVVAALEKSK